MKLKEIKDLNIEEGTRVILRLDFNVPINENGEIENTYRIDESLSTIKVLKDLGAKIIIVAHKEKGSLDIVYKYLETKLENISWNKKEDLSVGEISLLENIRLDSREKNEDESVRDELGAEISKLGDVFINDAFSASHRNHASITSIPKFIPGCFGPNFVTEVKNLSLALEPIHPTFVIIGGAKFDTKLKMLEKFISISDKIFVGGALAHTFWKNKGYGLGTSLVDDEVILSDEITNSPKIILPVDVLTEDKTNKLPSEIQAQEKIVDFGENTLLELKKIVDESETIIWNGPLGFYEKGYVEGTQELVKYLGMQQDKIVILGGGDTLTVLENLYKENPVIKTQLRFTHVSSAGGAMIDFLSNGTIPGIQAIK